MTISSPPVTVTVVVQAGSAFVRLPNAMSIEKGEGCVRSSTSVIGIANGEEGAANFRASDPLRCGIFCSGNLELGTLHVNLCLELEPQMNHVKVKSSRRALL